MSDPTADARALDPCAPRLTAEERARRLIGHHDPDDLLLDTLRAHARDAATDRTAQLELEVRTLRREVERWRQFYADSQAAHVEVMVERDNLRRQVERLRAEPARLRAALIDLAERCNSQLRTSLTWGSNPAAYLQGALMGIGDDACDAAGVARLPWPSAGEMELAEEATPPSRKTVEAWRRENTTPCVLCGAVVEITGRPVCRSCLEAR